MPDGSYQHLLEHLDAATRFDGFVAALVDIRDSMVFYDRDLMLVGYTGHVEALIISALAWACMEGDEPAVEAFGAVRRLVEALPQRLAPPEDAPMDVQAVVQAFLRVGAWVLRERVDAVVAAMDRYRRDDYDPRATVDALVLEAQLAGEANPRLALDRLGQAGALMLRGQALRSRWLSVVPPRVQLWLTGLRNMAGHLAATWESFPWASIGEQRRRRAPSRVVDLQSVRRRRALAMEAWRMLETPRPVDEVDLLIERVFAGPAAVDDELVASLASRGEQPIPLLLAMVWSHHLADPQAGVPEAVAAAIRALTRLGRREVVPRLIELVTDATTAPEVAVEALQGLEAMGAQAVEGVSEYLRRVPYPRGGPALARVLTRLPRSEKTFQALIDLFQRLGWEEGKLAVASALAEYGDGRAVPVLEQALQDPQLPTADHRRALEGALRRLAGGGSGRRRVAKG